MSNNNLTNAKKAKNDEFYTQYVDIEKELQYYNFEDKIVYCNCDNPQYSNFYKYFKDKFYIHKIKHLYCTGYNKDGNGYYAEYNGTEEIIKPLNDNGDFRNEECINILKIADVIITNPPFSLFREYVAQLMEYGKKFLIIGNQNAITYKEIFPYIKNNELWLGLSMNGSNRWFQAPDDYEVKENAAGYKVIDGKKYYFVNGVTWFTNMPHIKQNKPLILTKTYNPIYYPQYDNYMAINVDKVKDIPIDYDGVMGVPITFLQYYNPKQFEIIKFRKGDDDKDLSYNGNTPYFRILIKKNDSLEQVEFEIVGLMSGAKGENLTNGNDNRAKFYINNKGVYARLLIKRKQ